MALSAAENRNLAANPSFVAETQNPGPAGSRGVDAEDHNLPLHGSMILMRIPIVIAAVVVVTLLVVIVSS